MTARRLRSTAVLLLAVLAVASAFNAPKMPAPKRTKKAAMSKAEARKAAVAAAAAEKRLAREEQAEKRAKAIYALKQLAALARTRQQARRDEQQARRDEQQLLRRAKRAPARPAVSNAPLGESRKSDADATGEEPATAGGIVSTVGQLAVARMQLSLLDARDAVMEAPRRLLGGAADDAGEGQSGDDRCDG